MFQTKTEIPLTKPSRGGFAPIPIFFLFLFLFRLFLRIIPLAVPLARELPMLQRILPLSLHLFDGEFAGAIVLLLDASEDGGVLALDAVQLLLPAADVERLGLSRGRLSAASSVAPHTQTQRSVSQRHSGEFGENCFKHLGDLANIWVDYHPPSQSQRATYRPTRGSER